MQYLVDIMTGKGWNKTEFISGEKAFSDDYSWHKGFFIADGGSNTWRRNYNELLQRDLALFAVGDVRGKDVLDIGCGFGMYLLTFLRMGVKSASGIDIDASLIERGRKYMVNNNFEADFRVEDCTKLSHTSNSFDIIFTGDVFEHLTEIQKQQCIAEVYRVLRPGGIVVIKTPNLSYLKFSLFFKRIKGLLKFQNPLNIHIAHTRNNPDNEHIGLTTHKALSRILIDNTFHEPQITFQKLNRKAIPASISKRLRKVLFLNQDIIISARKPIFLGFYP
jgi:2-polyprenyl-3-methyl-5-hydroxy-6-metoxy-1,4-benzoquinol methylase